MADTIITESRFAVNGIELNVAQSGSGPPVLLLHGFPDRWQLWRHQIPALVDAGFHVIAPDLRGFGESERPDAVTDYAVPTLIADVTALLDAIGVDRVAVVGHDWGAGLAWNVAMARPERVSQLAVISVGHAGSGSAAGLHQRQLSWYMLWFLFPGVAERVLPREDWAFFRRWIWSGARPGEEPDADRQIADLTRSGALTAGLNWYRANTRPEHFVPPDQPRPMRTVTCPTMGVWSSDDPVLGEVQMTASAAYVERSWRYERIEGCDHWVPIHAPDRLNELLLDFLER